MSLQATASQPDGRTGGAIISSDLSSRRSEQLYPTFSTGEVKRLSSFGTSVGYAAGDVVVGQGAAGPGLLLVLSGELAISGRQPDGQPVLIHVHRENSLQGEIAQLSGRASLIAVQALTDVDAIAIPAEGLRRLMIAEGTLGERIMRALILRRMLLQEQSMGGPTILGSAADPDVLRLQSFLERNAYPWLQLDPAEDVVGQALCEQYGCDDCGLPIVICPSGEVLHAPTEERLARCIGMTETLPAGAIYDVVIAGAGPAGLAAAVYAASEGLSVVLTDCRSFGGQAGASARIENFLGFPTGISGHRLMARASIQAQKFGVRTLVPAEVASLRSPVPDRHIVELSSGATVEARSVVIATGARYRQLPLEGLEPYEGTSIHYWASAAESRLVSRSNVIVVGGGNAAGQAAAFLAESAARVAVIARRPLAETMSHYLVERLQAIDNVEVHERCTVASVDGSHGALRSVEVSVPTGDRFRIDASHMFLFLGADPNTSWLKGSGVLLDRQGFVWTETAPPAGKFFLETSQSGVFAIGDVRVGSTKRVASAAGDGAQVVAAIHRFLSLEAKQQPLSAVPAV